MALPRRLEQYLARKRLSKRLSKQNPGNRSDSQSCRRCRERVAKRKERCRVNKKVTLLKLPAELRNQIYECALKEEFEVFIEQHPPEWLLACKQIHFEASQMWYTVNEFLTEIDDLDARRLEQWWWHVRSQGITPMIYMNIYPSLNWDNLIKWCNRVWSDNCPPAPPVNYALGDMAFETHAVVRIAQNVVWDHRYPVRWEDCQKALENLRMAISVYEPGWTADENWLIP